MGDIARESALKVLNALDKKNLTLDMVMEDYTAKGNKLTRLDRSLVNALVYGVIRWRGRIDFVITHFSKTPLTKIKPEILNTLRLGIFQILFMTKIPDSAAVNTSVNLAKKNAPLWVVKFVNGLLRNVTKNITSIPFPKQDDNILRYLAVEKSFPEWLIQKWIKRFGPDETISLCDAMNTIPGITLRTNTLKTSQDDLLEAITEDVESVSLTNVSPYGISVSRPKKQLSEFNTFKDGLFQVQDEAAQIVSMLLNPVPGDRVLDACAGLGGKTGHIAQLMANKGEIIAVDSIPAKLKSLATEMDRLGITIVTTSVMDLNEPAGDNSPGIFDKILVDAPCSGFGVIRRNPDGKWSQSKRNLKRYQKRQLTFLDTVKGLLKPGGVIVYAVCSTEPEEGKNVIDSFLQNNPDFTISKPDIEKFPKLSELTDSSGTISTLPHLHDMDGFFTARLIKDLK